jgi:hypothetical protein
MQMSTKKSPLEFVLIKSFDILNYPYNLWLGVNMVNFRHIRGQNEQQWVTVVIIEIIGGKAAFCTDFGGKTSLVLYVSFV